MHTVKRTTKGYEVWFNDDTLIARCKDWVDAFRLVNYLNGGTGEKHPIDIDYEVL